MFGNIFLQSNVVSFQTIRMSVGAYTEGLLCTARILGND